MEVVLTVDKEAGAEAQAASLVDELGAAMSEGASNVHLDLTLLADAATA